MNSIVKILSWRDWGIVRYNSIFQNLSALYFIAYVGLHWNLTFIVNALLFIFFSILMTGYGYLINDFADIDLDKHHQKPNSFANTKKSLAIWILLGVLICGAIFSLPFIKNIWFVIIWGIWIFVATTYSLPPLRFKEKGTLGLITTVLGQQVFPVALLFAAFTTPWSWGVFILILFTFSRGVSSDLGHQIRDWINDSQTDTCTFAVTYYIGIGINGILVLLPKGRVISLGIANFVDIAIGFGIYHFDNKNSWKLMASLAPGKFGTKRSL